MFFQKFFQILLISMVYTASAVPVIMNVLSKTPEEAARIDKSDPFQNLKELPPNFAEFQIPARVEYALSNQNPALVGGSGDDIGTKFDQNIFERVQYALVKSTGGSDYIFEKPVVPVKAIELRVLSEQDYIKLITGASGESKTISKPPAKYLPADDGYDYPRP